METHVNTVSNITYYDIYNTACPFYDDHCFTCSQFNGKGLFTQSKSGSESKKYQK